MIFNNQQIDTLRTVYFDQHRKFKNYRYIHFYSVIYEDIHGMNMMEGLFTYQEVLMAKKQIKKLNKNCRIFIENETETCFCNLQ